MTGNLDWPSQWCGFGFGFGFDSVGVRPGRGTMERKGHHFWSKPPAVYHTRPWSQVQERLCEENGRNGWCDVKADMKLCQIVSRSCCLLLPLIFIPLNSSAFNSLLGSWITAGEKTRIYPSFFMGKPADIVKQRLPIKGVGGDLQSKRPLLSVMYCFPATRQSPRKIVQV